MVYNQRADIESGLQHKSLQRTYCLCATSVLHHCVMARRRDGEKMDHSGLRSLRQTVGVSQARVARECGLDRVRVSLWEGGLVDLEAGEVARVSKYLHSALEAKLRQLGEMRQAVSA
jgi:hypothetical protein